MNMQVGDAWLRNWMQSLLLRFTSEVLGDERLDHLAADVLSEALADDSRRNFPLAKAGNAGQLLELLDDLFRLPRHNLSRHHYFDFAFATVFSFSRSQRFALS
jgi:hypothetical protein